MALSTKRGHGRGVKGEGSPDPSTNAVLKALRTVTDPEIPIIDIVEMGMVAAIHREGEEMIVELTPTFAGCPALDVIREDTRRAVAGVFAGPVVVRFVYDPPWTSTRLTEEGRRKLKAFGLAPPQTGCSAPSSDPAGTVKPVPCPHCDSTNTELESLFGPTLCRAIHYCRACLQSFEQFKDV